MCHMGTPSVGFSVLGFFPNKRGKSFWSFSSMKNKKSWAIIILALVVGISGCAKKADPERPIEKIKNETETMSVQDLETNALLYAKELKAQRAELDKIKAKMQALPIEKIFANEFMTNQVAKIGRKAEAYFERYMIYLGKLQENGADLSKVRLE